MRKPEKWHTFAKALAGGFVSIARLRAMGLGLARLTLWRWRNRFMQAQARHQADRLGGVIDRAGNIIETPITSMADVYPALGGRIAADSVICSDGAKTYPWIALNAASEHRRIWTPVKSPRPKSSKAASHDATASSG